MVARSWAQRSTRAGSHSSSRESSAGWLGVSAAMVVPQSRPDHLHSHGYSESGCGPAVEYVCRTWHRRGGGLPLARHFRCTPRFTGHDGGPHNNDAHRGERPRGRSDHRRLDTCTGFPCTCDGYDLVDYPWRLSRRFRDRRRAGHRDRSCHVSLRLGTAGRLAGFRFLANRERRVRPKFANGAARRLRALAAHDDLPLVR